MTEISTPRTCSHMRACCRQQFIFKVHLNVLLEKAGAGCSCSDYCVSSYAQCCSALCQVATLNPPVVLPIKRRCCHGAGGAACAVQRNILPPCIMCLASVIYVLATQRIIPCQRGKCCMCVSSCVWCHVYLAPCVFAHCYLVRTLTKRHI